MTEARREQTRRRGQRRRLLTGALSVAGHALAVLVLVGVQPDPPAAVEPPAMAVQLMELPPPPPPAPPVTAEEPKPAPKPVTPKPKPETKPPRKAVAPLRVAKLKPPPSVVPIAAGVRSAVDGVAEVSEGELTGAGTAESGSGAGGRGCNMTRRVQAALRKDHRVRAAVADAERGKALRVWNGDWVRHGEQEGAGLAAVREAIMWEVGFAPEACRSEPMHGLIMLSMNDAPGSPRLVVGQGSWRWSDMLFSQRGGSSRR